MDRSGFYVILKIVLCQLGFQTLTDGLDKALAVYGGGGVQVGAENMYFEEKGAYTGEISAEMLVDAGVKYVVIGHSERRDYFKEDDVLLNKKVKKAIEAGLTPILCCGETLEQREMGVTLDWIRLQIKSDLTGIKQQTLQTW